MTSYHALDNDLPRHELFLFQILSFIKANKAFLLIHIVEGRPK